LLSYAVRVPRCFTLGPDSVFTFSGAAITASGFSKAQDREDSYLVSGLWESTRGYGAPEKVEHRIRAKVKQRGTRTGIGQQSRASEGAARLDHGSEFHDS